MKTVHIDFTSGGPRSYDILIGPGLLAKLPFPAGGRSFFILSDENTKAYAETIRTGLSAARRVEMLTLKPGEGTKSFSQFEAVCRWMLQGGVDRKSCLIAVGGGVMGDLGGFAAASVMRGIDFIQIPTSLLAQVDSSVGGKTGINAPEGKNLIGAFYQPRLVLADLDTLKTLPHREVLAGYAEIAKYGLLGDEKFFNWLEANGSKVVALEPEALTYAIEQSVRMKAAIVAEDEREQGRRALLNLGHTFGHALEAAALYDGRLLHGEAVAIGMVMAFDLSAKLGLCSAADAARAKAHLDSVGLPTSKPSFIKESPADLIEIMRRDKKAEGGRMAFILARAIGQAFVSKDVDDKDVLAVLA